MWDVDSGKELKKFDERGKLATFRKMRLPHFAKSCEFTPLRRRFRGGET